MKPSTPRMPLLVLGEWIMTLPTAFLLGAAALRLLQPREFEPARTAWIFVEWATTHLSHWGAGILFLALPLLAAILAGMTLLRSWRGDEALRQDMTLAANLVRRHALVFLSALATLLAGAILAFVLVHMITD
jgi:hypothetical protein